MSSFKLRLSPKMQRIVANCAYVLFIAKEIWKNWDSYFTGDFYLVLLPAILGLVYILFGNLIFIYFINHLLNEDKESYADKVKNTTNAFFIILTAIDVFYALPIGLEFVVFANSYAIFNLLYGNYSKLQFIQKEQKGDNYGTALGMLCIAAPSLFIGFVTLGVDHVVGTILLLIGIFGILISFLIRKGSMPEKLTLACTWLLVYWYFTLFYSFLNLITYIFIVVPVVNRDYYILKSSSLVVISVAAIILLWYFKLKHRISLVKATP